MGGTSETKEGYLSGRSRGSLLFVRTSRLYLKLDAYEYRKNLHNGDSSANHSGAVVATIVELVVTVHQHVFRPISTPHCSVFVSPGFLLRRSFRFRGRYPCCPVLHLLSFTPNTHIAALCEV